MKSFVCEKLLFLITFSQYCWYDLFLKMRTLFRLWKRSQRLPTVANRCG